VRVFLSRTALEEDIPFIDPEFYSTCPDETIEHIFRPAPRSKEPIPLLKERIAILRENGGILVKVKHVLWNRLLRWFVLTFVDQDYGGSFANLIRDLQQKTPNLTALDVVLKVIEVFPSFRDVTTYEGREGLPDHHSPLLSASLTRPLSVHFLKRAQILVAETWAAFFPSSNQIPHPILPGGGIHQLTMFADYRVPHILHHLKILIYPPSLLALLESGHYFEHGSREEVSIRAASIVAVERVRDEILALRHQDKEIPGTVTTGGEHGVDVPVSSVLIDFFLWDIAKRMEGGEEIVVPAHRTRSIWY